MFRAPAAVAAVTVLLAACQDPQVAPLDEIEHVLQDQAAAWNAGDIETFVSYYDPEATFLSSGGLVRGRQAVLERYRRAYPAGQMGRLSFSDLEGTMLSPESALLLGRYALAYEDGRSATGRFSLVFRQNEHGWTIFHDHTSADPPPESPPDS